MNHLSSEYIYHSFHIQLKTINNLNYYVRKVIIRSFRIYLSVEYFFIPRFMGMPPLQEGPLLKSKECREFLKNRLKKDTKE